MNAYKHFILELKLAFILQSVVQKVFT